VPDTPPTPQTLTDLVVRRSQRRDCLPPVPRHHPTPPLSPVSAVDDLKVAGISSEPPPAPPRHRQLPWRSRRRRHPREVPRPTNVCPAPLLSLSWLDKIRLPRPDLCGSDPEYDRFRLAGIRVFLDLHAPYTAYYPYLVVLWGFIRPRNEEMV
jgi:hypothetical protein